MLQDPVKKKQKKKKKYLKKKKKFMALYHLFNDIHSISQAPAKEKFNRLQSMTLRNRKKKKTFYDEKQKKCITHSLFENYEVCIYSYTMKLFPKIQSR